jgi:F0F1-type ATP synthase membrane subunit b/b'
MSETPSTTTSAKGSLHVPVLFGLVIALIVSNVILFVWMENVKRDTAQMRDSLLTEVAKVRETHTLSTASSRLRLDELRAELETARSQATTGVGQARKEALKHADELAARLQEEQRRQQAQVATELTQVKDAATTANTKIADVSNDVGSVKTEVAATKSELDKTIADLKTVRGDLGVQSGLIATNGTELSALKALGDRNYFEFNLQKTKAAQKVGNILVLLKKTDTKKNQYTVELIADDKRVEKKDKSINEPLQFYQIGSKQPCELVVNEVRKDVVVGYLSTPKLVTTARN